jgi:N6-adenosine-specific RNA methylase IME4
MIRQALTVMHAWGFAYKSMGAWAKQSSTGAKWAFGTGFVYRSAAEFSLYGTIGKPKQKAHNVRNLIVDPVREHSRKPEQMRKNIEALWDGPYLEMFSRETAPGWDSWGHETTKFDEAA